jgi:hypothetical protein
VTVDDYAVALIDKAEQASADAAARGALLHAVDACVMARHGLAHVLGEDRPPPETEIGEGLRKYGQGPQFSVWLSWRAAERLREARDAWDSLTAARARKKTGAAE